jgi:hypothetical protein
MNLDQPSKSVVSGKSWLRELGSRALRVVALAGVCTVALCLNQGTSLAQAAPPADAAPDTKPAKPDPKAVEEARTRYERGKALYGEGEYGQALIEFERAYSLAPAYRVLYNIGQAAAMSQQYPKAIKAFEDYLKDGAQRIAPARRQQVDKELDNLRERVATLRVTADVEGAEILIDDEVVGTSPLPAGITVNAGRHVVAARMAGHSDDRELVTLAGKDDVEVKLELPELPKTPPITLVEPVPGQPPAPPVPGQVARTPKGPSYLWAGWLVTGILGAGAVATGIAAISATDKLGQVRESPDATREELDDKQSTARALGIAADVLIASSVVSLGFTLYFTIAESTSDDGADEALEVRVTPGGATLVGRF